MNEHNDESNDERAFVHSRLIDAPCARVYQAFSDPAHLARWWGPNGFSNTFSEFDLRPGGRWRFVMHGPDGSDYPNESLFIEVVPQQRVVIEHLNGHHFLLTIRFNAQGSQTRVDWRQEFDSVAEHQRIAALVIPANEQNLDRLAAEVLNVA
ncbi:MAG: SRPBCC family protein [Pseudomonas sp.]